MKPDRTTHRSSDRPVFADWNYPHDPALENAVLGAILMEPHVVADIRAILSPECFYEAQNARIYEVICQLDDRGQQADLVSVSQWARREQIASAAYVASLTTSVGSGVQVRQHALMLAELDLRRQLMHFGLELVTRAQNSSEDPAVWAAGQLDAITGTACRIETARPLGDALDDALHRLETRQQAAQQGACVGITTGLPNLDRITGGWRGGQLVVLAGRPAMGKTALSLLFARASAEAGTPVCYFSLEMPDTQLADRMLVGAAQIRAQAFRAGTLASEEWQRLEYGVQRLRTLPLYLFDTAAVSMTQIRAQARSMQRKGRCGLVIIDYLQLIASTDDRRNNREREVAEMSRAAKLLAKELNIPVVLLSQLSRKVEERTDKTPLLSDLRESGAIEQDADLVLFIDRPAVNGIREFDAGRFGMIDSCGVGRLTIAKNREGTTGFMPFRHNESLTAIYDFDAETPS